MEQKRKHPATVAEMALRGIKEDVPLYKMIEIVKDALISYGYKDGPKEESEASAKRHFEAGDFCVCSEGTLETQIFINKFQIPDRGFGGRFTIYRHAHLKRGNKMNVPYALDVKTDGFIISGSSRIRLATPEEKQLLLDELAKAGYQWDEENKQVVKNRWKPEMDETYYTPYCMGSGLSPYKTSAYEWKNDDLEVETWENGRIFQTKEGCDAFCQKLNEAIQNVKRE